MRRKGNTHALLVGMQTGAATVGRNMELPQKIKNGTSYDQAIPVLGIYLKKSKRLIQKNICNPMFTATLFKSQNLEAAHQ